MGSRRLRPVRIAGAGIAGLSTAIGLALRGHPVEVFDAARDSGTARHPEWDAIENWTSDEDVTDLLARYGIKKAFDHRSPLEFEVMDGRRTYHVATRRPLFYLLKRGAEPGSLEQSLKAQALELGATLHYGAPRRRDEVDVWAAGAQRGGAFLGAGLTFRTTHPDTVVGLVSTRFAPKAYAYLVIVDGRGTVAVVITERFADARRFVRRSVDAFRRAKGFDMSNVRWSSGFGARATAFWQHDQGTIAVGEAGGFQDFLWGFGIRHALVSGQLAAQALDAGIDYERLVRREIHPLVRASMVNRLLYDWSDDRVYRRLIRRFAASSDLTDTLQLWYRRSPLSYVLWPLAARHVRRRDRRVP